MTASTAVSRILDNARAHLPGALEGAMRMELFNVYKELTQRTNCWQEELQFVVTPALYEYPLATNQSGAFINRLIWIEGPRAPTSAPESGSPRQGILLTPGVLTVYLRIPYPPGNAETWYAHVALTIADPMQGNGLSYAPDWIADKYHETLVHGLVYRMMTQPAKPYSNLQGALFHGKKFNQGISLARTEVLHGNTFRGNSWRYPQSFRVSR